MFDSTLLYSIISKGTSYDVIIGGGELASNFDKGSVIITLIQSKVLSQSYKDFEKIEQDEQGGYITAYTRIQNNYQFDLYRANPRNLGYIDVERESIALREYLKSYDVQEYLSKHNVSILPAISQISYLNDFTEQKKLINRAFFEVSVIFEVSSKEKVDMFDIITINNIIAGG